MSEMILHATILYVVSYLTTSAFFTCRDSTQSTHSELLMWWVFLESKTEKITFSVDRIWMSWYSLHQQGGRRRGGGAVEASSALWATTDIALWKTYYSDEFIFFPKKVVIKITSHVTHAFVVMSDTPREASSASKKWRWVTITVKAEATLWCHSGSENPVSYS